VHVFYRQAMMFVQYLKARSESAFRDFLLRIQEGEDFAAALADTYNMTLGDAGRAFFEALTPPATAVAVAAE
jgi:hypothetical protein